MKKLTIVLLFASFHPLFSQADLLPQIFGTLPIEFSQGLPEGMSYQEYRMAMRNVDFMTMGMSMILPGYGFFSSGTPGGSHRHYHPPGSGDGDDGLRHV
jgi:hypothetical protein